MKAAVIGTGSMGRNHARLYADIEGVELVAVADVSQDAKGVADKYGCRFYTGHKEMIETEKPDIVSVCVPTSLHYEVSKFVIEKGVNLLIEKPIASRVEEAEELVELAKKAKVKLAVGHIERFNPAVQRLKKLIDEGKLGNVTSILARRVGLYPPRIRDANVIIDIAVHDIDVFNYLLGKEPSKVFSCAGKALINDREDYADIFLKYNGTNGIIEVNWITPVKIRKLNVTGTKGYAELNYISQELTLYESVYERTYDKFGEFVKFGETIKKEIKGVMEEPLKLELINFIDAVREDREPLVNGVEGLNVLKTATEIIRNSGEN